MKNFSLSQVASIALASGVALLAQANPAAAFSVNFTNIFPIQSSSESSIDPYVNNFTAEVSNLGSNQVAIYFRNNSPVGAIGSVYIQDPTSLLSSATVNYNNIGNVDFENVSNPNLPQGNKIGFDERFGYKFDGGANKMVQKDEVLGIRFSANYNSLLSAYTAGQLRFGMHIQQISYNNQFGRFNDASDAIVSDNSQAVPEPATMLGLAIAGGALTAVRSRKRRLATADDSGVN